MVEWMLFCVMVAMQRVVREKLYLRAAKRSTAHRKEVGVGACAVANLLERFAGGTWWWNGVIWLGHNHLLSQVKGR